MKTIKDGSGEIYTYNDNVSMPIVTKKYFDYSPYDIIDNTICEINQQIAHTVDEDIMNQIFQEMAKRFNQVPLMEHKCNNCGAAISMDADRHLFVCGYCGSAYVVGTAQINS